MTFSDPIPRNRCGTRLWDDVEAVQCVREDGHHAGHIYSTSDGSAVGDRHVEPDGESW